jgi:hypothetical protein
LATTVLVLLAMGLVMGLVASRMVHEEEPAPASPAPVPVREVPVEGDGLVAERADPPEDAEWSEAQIRSAYEVAFDQETDPAAWNAVVDAPTVTPEALLGMVAGCGPVSPVIASISFTSPDDAYVRFRLVGSSVSGSSSAELSGGAVRRDGAWKVTGYTFDPIVGLADSACG